MELEALSLLIDQLVVLFDSIGHSIVALTAAEMAMREFTKLVG